MRAQYIKELINKKLKELDLYNIEGDSLHHLLNVARLKEGENILLLDGNGSSYLTVINKIEKKRVEVEIKKVSLTPKSNLISVAVAISQKDAMEYMLKTSIELGISNFIPIVTEHSLKKFEINSNRIERIVESAMNQSNNSFALNISPVSSLQEINLDNFDGSFIFSTKQINSLKRININKNHKYLILIGPEAGFSQNDLEIFQENQNIETIHLPTPILRAQNALCASVGHILARV